MFLWSTSLADKVLNIDHWALQEKTLQLFQLLKFLDTEICFVSTSEVHQEYFQIFLACRMGLVMILNQTSLEKLDVKLKNCSRNLIILKLFKFPS